MVKTFPEASPPKTYRNAQGIYLTKQLFYEFADDKSLAFYTIKDTDLCVGDAIYPSIHRLFVETEDPSEYIFATTYFDSWRHYKKLLSASWFSACIDEAREELTLKLAARNLIALKKKAAEGDFRANQYLLEQKWKEDSSVGRPSKAKIKQEADRLFAEKDDISDDLSRIISFPSRS